MSFLHIFNSRAFALNCYGVSISFSPAFLIEASSSEPFFMAGTSADEANYPTVGFYPKSRFSNLSIVGLSNPF